MKDCMSLVFQNVRIRFDKVASYPKALASTFTTFLCFPYPLLSTLHFYHSFMRLQVWCLCLCWLGHSDNQGWGRSSQNSDMNVHGWLPMKCDASVMSKGMPLIRPSITELSFHPLTHTYTVNKFPHADFMKILSGMTSLRPWLLTFCLSVFNLFGLWTRIWLCIHLVRYWPMPGL